MIRRFKLKYRKIYLWYAKVGNSGFKYPIIDEAENKKALQTAELNYNNI